MTARSTGRFLLVLDDEHVGDVAACLAAVRAATGVEEVVCTADAPDATTLGAAPAVLFAELGIAVVATRPTLGAGAGGARVVAVEPERIVRALPILRTSPVLTDAQFLDTDTATWGLAATGAAATTLTGAGITLAVLDTGLDLDHPDLAGREVTARSFVAGQSAHDVHGHGTHCAGTAAGPRGTQTSPAPEQGPGYGVAPGVALLVGKVLGDDGTGTDADILAALSWAVGERAAVVSLSLGADERAVSVAYETAGRRALAAGTLIVAAAGNNAQRSAGEPGFVGVPANSPSIMAVGALDAALAVADFSAAATDVDGGEIDIAGPGVAVYSSWPMPQRYDTISGTSMATPHVAGAAALWAQRTGARGRDLWDVVVGAARALPLPAADVGAGLVQVPRDVGTGELRDVTVTVAEGYDIGQVAARLGVAGMTVEQVLAPVGIVTGTVPVDWPVRRGLDLAGVEAVEGARRSAIRSGPE